MAGDTPKPKPDVGASALLGTIGGTIFRKDTVLDVMMITSEHGHEIEGLVVVTDRGRYRVSVTPEPEPAS